MGFEQPEVRRYDLPRHSALAVDTLNLQQQAFFEAACAYARRIEGLHYVESFLDFLRPVFSGSGDFLQRGRNIAVLIEVADDRLRRVTDAVGNQANAQLRPQMIAQSNGSRQESLKGRFLYRFRGRTLVAGVEVVVEERAEIDLIERIG